MARKCPICEKEVPNKATIKEFPEYMFCKHCGQIVKVGAITGRSKK